MNIRARLEKLEQRTPMKDQSDFYRRVDLIRAALRGEIVLDPSTLQDQEQHERRQLVPTADELRRHMR